MGKKPKKVGVTAMTKDAHGFEGFAVRMQRKGYRFRKYVSSSKRTGLPGNLNQRRCAAFNLAVADRLMIEGVFNDKKSWRNDALTKPAIKKLTDAGFIHDYAGATN